MKVFKRYPSLEELNDVVGSIAGDLCCIIDDVAEHHRYAISDLQQMITPLLTSCGGSAHAITFLDFPIWDNEDLDEREIDEGSKGFDCKTDLATHLRAKMAKIMKQVGACAAALEG